MKKSSLAAAIAFATLASCANASQGTVTFNGEINDTPCSIDASDQHQTINMGSVTSSALSGGGTSNPVPFTIKLTQCDNTTKKTVATTFTGPAASFGTGLLGISGNTTNAAIRLLDASDKPLQLGTATSQPLLAGQNDLRFKAQLIGDATTDATPGVFSSVANFTMTYP